MEDIDLIDCLINFEKNAFRHKIPNLIETINSIGIKDFPKIESENQLSELKIEEKINICFVVLNEMLRKQINTSSKEVKGHVLKRKEYYTVMNKIIMNLLIKKVFYNMELVKKVEMKNQLMEKQLMVCRQIVIWKINMIQVSLMIEMMIIKYFQN